MSALAEALVAAQAELPCALAAHHADITSRNARAARALLSTLSDAEYAYMVTTGGEDYAERAYGVSYER